MRLKFIGKNETDLISYGFIKIVITSNSKYHYNEYSKNGCNIMISKTDNIITHDSSKRNYKRTKDTIDEFIKIVDQLIIDNIAKYISL